MKALIRGAVAHPTAVNVLMVGLVVGGLFATRAIPRESFPKVELDMVLVRVAWRGRTPEEVEEGLIIKIEEAVHSIEGVDSITSTVSQGGGGIVLELKKGTDRERALDDVRNAVDEIPNFPSDIEPITVQQMTNRQNVVGLIVHGPMGPKVMRDLSTRLRDELLALPSVSEVLVEGLRTQELAIEIRPQVLQEIGLGTEDVLRAVRAANVELSAGTMRTEHEDFLVKTGLRGYTAEALERIIVRTREDGDQILLRDVASVREQEVERTYAMRFHKPAEGGGRMTGRPAFLLQIRKTEDEDVVEIADVVKGYAAGLSDRLPPGVQVDLWRDRTTILHQRIDLLGRNGLMGLLLIFLSLWLFTQFKLSIWVVAGLPVAVFGSAILIGMTGTTINMISLFGLLLVSGILVDDAIVVSENVYAHIERGVPPRLAAVQGTIEVYPAVVASILTTIIAFSAFFFMGGTIGKFVRAIPVVVICALIMSLVECLIVLPPHLAHALKPPGEAKTVLGRMRRGTDRVMDLLLKRPYAFALKIFLRLRWPMVALGVALLLITIGYIRGGFIKFLFFPNLDADDIQAEYLLEPGAPESLNRDFVSRVERAASEASVGLKKEQTDGSDVIERGLTTFGGEESESGVVHVELLPGEERDASASEISKRWRKALGPAPEARWLTVGPRRRGPFGKPVHVELLSEHQAHLEEAAGRLKRELEGYPGAYDVSDDLVIGKRELVVDLNARGRAAGLTVQALASQLRNGIYGGRVEVLQRGRDELEVWVRFPREDRSSLGQLSELRLRTPQGEEIALSDVATWRTRRGLATVKRFDRQRRVTVSAAVDPSAGDAESILDDLKDRALPELLADYPGMRASFEGQSRQRRKMIGGFVKALPWALAAMFSVLVVVFGSYIQAFLVMTMIPLGIVGAVVGHILIDMPLTVLSIWGIVALGGILVNDSIVFVDAINRRLARGEPFMESVHLAGVSRFRPILLTTLTTAAGLLLLILEQSRQAQFLIPMAASLAFGLLVGTIFTLGVLPAGYVCINDGRRGWHFLRHGDWPAREEVEPAVYRALEKKEDVASAAVMKPDGSPGGSE